MAYLAARRVGLAAELLHETDATVGSVARKVGSSNAFTLGVAFKRYHGITPTEHRAAALRAGWDEFLTKVGQGIGDAVRAWCRRQETASTTHPAS